MNAMSSASCAPAATVLCAESDPSSQSEPGGLPPLPCVESTQVGIRHLVREIAPLEGDGGSEDRSGPEGYEKRGVTEVEPVAQRIGGDVVVVGGGLSRELEGVDQRAERADEVGRDAKGSRKPDCNAPSPADCGGQDGDRSEGEGEQGGGRGRRAEVRRRDVHAHDLDADEERN